MNRLRQGTAICLFGAVVISVSLLLIVCLLVNSAGGAPGVNQANSFSTAASLRRQFQNPPDDARIMMRWWWFGPAVADTEIERELRQMQMAGIGGVEVQPVYPLALDDRGSGIKNLPYLSDDFIHALTFASEKARQLGLRFDLTLGSGWPYGGPSVPVSEAAGRLRIERLKTSVATRLKVPSLGAGEKLLAVFLVSAPAATGLQQTREITDIADGAIRLPDDFPNPLEVQFFIASRTGMQVKRAALGAEGFVLDHLDRLAIDNYLGKVGDRLMQAFGAHPPYAVFCDSLEVYNSDWTGDFLVEFQKRRGYDLRPHLPALAADVPNAAAIRHDWGRTITELLNERFLAPLHEWARLKGTRLRVQDYGPPGAVLSSNAYADLPEGEGPQWKTLSATRWASSASHLFGHTVTSSETWTWLHSPSFRATPLDVKAEADRHFLQGINQLIGHGWPYTPEGVQYPGWRFYAAAAFNENNPWWIVMPDVSRYLQRLSFLLRQGQPAADVAIYLPNDDAWAGLKNGNTSMIEALRERLGPKLIELILESGYGFDLFDDDAFSAVGRIENNSLSLGNNKYRIVILPSVNSIPVETLAKLEQFARAGGTLIATRQMPSAAPGFLAADGDHQKVKELSRRLFEGDTPLGHFVPDETSGLRAALVAALAPDLALSPPAPELGFIHRRLGDADIYFLANTGNSALQTIGTFRVSATSAEWWDPMTGAVRPGSIAGNAPGATSIATIATSIKIDLDPYESRVLVFLRGTGEPYQSGAASVPPVATPNSSGALSVDLSQDWQVTFTGSTPQRFTQLRSWTDDERTRFYSGIVTYEKSVTLGPGQPDAGARIMLSLGEGQIVPMDTGPRVNGMRALLDGPVREAAVVWINNQRAGSVWCPPYSLDVTRYLKAGENRIRIVVGNTAVNFMAGHSLPDYRLLNLRYGERFQAQDMDKLQPVPSGLMGPIRLNWVQR